MGGRSSGRDGELRAATAGDAGEAEQAGAEEGQAGGLGARRRPAINGRDADTRAVLENDRGGDGAGTTPEQFGAKFREDVARYAKLIRQINLPPAD